MTHRIHRIIAATLAVFAGAILVGCSQVQALAPVGGNHESEVRFASIDVLTKAGTPILTAPVCATSEAGAVTCTGKTTTGETITGVSPAEDVTKVTVTVGTSVLYSGSIMDVLNAAARSTS